MRLVEAYGLGSLAPNTIMLGASQTAEYRERYCDVLRDLYHHQRNVVVVRDPSGRGFGERKRIDVWWGGLQGNGSLLMILAYLLRTSLPWRGVDVRLKMVVPSERAAEDARANLERVIEATRTGLQPEVLVSDGRPALELLEASSQGADLILMGLREPADDIDYVAYYEGLMARTEQLPTTMFVLAAEQVAFREVLFRDPDE